MSVAVGFAAGVGGCIRHSTQEGSFCPGATPATENVAAFQSTLYPVLQNQGCVQCHSGDGTLGPGSFANADPTVAYPDASIARYVNVQDPAQSFYVTQQTNPQHAHCQFESCSQLQADLTSAIAAWVAKDPLFAASGTDCATPTPSPTPGVLPVYTTETKTIALSAQSSDPSGVVLPTSGAAIDVVFSQIQGAPALERVALKVSLALQDASNAGQPGVPIFYRVAKPIFATAQTLEINDVRFIVDGNESSLYTAFQDVDSTVGGAPFSLTASWPSTFQSVSSFTQMIQMNGIGPATLQFRFGAQTPSGSP